MKFFKSIIFLFAIVIQLIFGFNRIRKYKKLKPESRENSLKKTTFPQPRFAEIVDLPNFNTESFKPATFESTKYIIPKYIEKDESDPNFLENKIQVNNIFIYE
jgi:hypothetical protein